MTLTHQMSHSDFLFKRMMIITVNLIVHTRISVVYKPAFIRFQGFLAFISLRFVNWICPYH